MKEMLLYPVRPDIGLGYDFYYNNDPESVHRNIKARQKYKATEMLTVAENIRKERNANLCYVEDAIIGNGPFELSPEFAHFKVDQYSWTYHWSEEKKQKHLRQFHEAISTDPLRIGTSKAGADHCNQEDELGLTEREEGQPQEGRETPPEETREICEEKSTPIHHRITKPRSLAS